MKRPVLSVIFAAVALLTMQPCLASTNILGQPQASADRMYQFVMSKNPGSSFTREISDAFYNQGTKYGIRGDIALCQAAVETGWFRYTGGTAVTPSDHNYCGLGVTTKGQKGCQFSTVAEGVSAQLQHLWAYATTAALPSGWTLVDPRFKYVNRGCAPTWEGLGGKWASSTTYGSNILSIYNSMMAFTLPDPPSLTVNPTSVTLTAVQGGTSPTATVKVTGKNLSSKIVYNGVSSAYIISASNWDDFTGGTLSIKLDTSKDPKSYDGYVAVQSGSGASLQRVQITVNATITAPAPVANPTITASPTSITLQADKDATAPYADVTVTAKDLSAAMTYASNSSAFTVSALSGWNANTGGKLRITLNTAKTPGTYDGYVAVQSNSVRCQINVCGIINKVEEPAPDPIDPPQPPTTELTLPTKFATAWVYSGANGKTSTYFDASNNLTRNMALKGDNLYVVQRADDGANIRILDAKTGVMKGSLPTGDLAADSYRFTSVANLGGTIVACNLAFGATSALRVYAWPDENAGPQLILETTNHGARSGDLMSATGTFANGKLYFASNGGYEGKLFVFNVKNGAVSSTTPTVVTLKDASGNAVNMGGSAAVIEVKAMPDGNIVCSGKGAGTTVFTPNGAFVKRLGDAAVDGATYGASFEPITFGKYQLAACVCYQSPILQGYLNLVNITDGFDAPSVLNSYPVLGTSANKNDTFVTTALASVEDNVISLYTLIPKQGIARYTAIAPSNSVSDITVDGALTVTVDGNTVKAVAGQAVLGIRIVALNGTEVARNIGNSVNVASLAKGLHVAVVTLADGQVVSRKIWL